MEHFDEVILEDYFLSIGNISIKERNDCINMIINSKDMNGSRYKLNDKSSGYYSLFSLILNKQEDNSIFFDGQVFSDDENREIYGSIKMEENEWKIYIVVNRLNDYFFGHNKSYDVKETFHLLPDHRAIRETTYNDEDIVVKEDIMLLDDDKIEEYLNNKVESIKLKKRQVNE